MRVLVACEYSGIVRDAFTAAGHDAMSCDLRPSETPGPHYQGNIFDVLQDEWDLMIAHPPCTYLANSGVRWLYDPRPKFARRWEQLEEGARFFRRLLDADVPRIAVENPTMHGHGKRRVGQDPSQKIHPWQFGHGETKATYLWLLNLPPLVPTNIVDGREARVHNMAPSPDRQKERSRFFPGIAAAMADQWGNLPVLGSRVPADLELAID